MCGLWEKRVGAMGKLNSLNYFNQQHLQQPCTLLSLTDEGTITRTKVHMINFHNIIREITPDFKKYHDLQHNPHGPKEGL